VRFKAGTGQLGADGRLGIDEEMAAAAIVHNLGNLSVGGLEAESQRW
jgi:hypothetical protein